MTEPTKSAARPRAGLPTGPALLHDPLLNKGTAFTAAERRAFGLTGLLPPHVHTMDEQVARVLDNYRRKPTDLERWIHLMSLQDRNETLFYRVVTGHLEEMMPIIYTPTEDRGHVADLLRNWPLPDVRVIVITDGERIQGLGDQGVGGMGIPVGKLALYTSCAGIHPSRCLPVMLDVGTENEAYLKDPLYMGLRRHRVRGKEFDDLVAEFMAAVQVVMPKAMVQFEDFANTTAFPLLEHWRDRACTFNDDIQGTAAVTLAGIYSALRVTGKALREQRILFLGAGEAGVGIADLIVSAMVDEGATPEQARQNCWFVDTKGLVVKSRAKLAEHKLRYAHDHPPAPDFLTALRNLKPTAIVGVSTIAKSFSKDVIEAMSRLNERPIIFALSNPTSKAECSAEEAYTWSKGKAIFASGSPFPTFVYEGKTFVPGQSNNSYIFPGIGLGVLASEATRVTDRMFSAAARDLASQTSQADLDMGRMFPSLTKIREVSAHIAVAVAEVAYKDGLAALKRPASIPELVRSRMWAPLYEDYLA